MNIVFVFYFWCIWCFIFPDTVWVQVWIPARRLQPRALHSSEPAHALWKGKDTEISRWGLHEKYYVHWSRNNNYYSGLLKFCPYVCCIFLLCYITFHFKPRCSKTNTNAVLWSKMSWIVSYSILYSSKKTRVSTNTVIP